MRNVATTPASPSSRHQTSPEDTASRLPGSTGSAARTVLGEVAIRRSLMRIAHEILERNDEAVELYLVAIPNGGVPLGRRLVANLKELADLSVPLGILDTSLYRDDLSSTGARPRLRHTEMPSSVDGRIVILVEDVVNTGRTIRAAMDALMDFGRPRAVQVVALVDRGHRELPIRIDYVGKNIPTHADESVVLRGADGGLEEGLHVVVQPSAGSQEGGA